MVSTKLTDAMMEQLRRNAGLGVAGLGSITCTTSRETLATADIIFDPSVKVAAKDNNIKLISAACKDNALIVVNSKHKNIDAIATNAVRPQNVIGTRTY